MDFNLLVASDTAECTIVDPLTGKKTEIVITVHSPYTKKYQEAFAAEKKRAVSDPVGLLADLIKDWKNAELNGKSLPFNRRNAEKVLSMKNTVVKVQLERFILDQKNFFPER